MPDLSLMAIARKVGEIWSRCGSRRKVKSLLHKLVQTHIHHLMEGASDALSDSIELTLELTRAKVLRFLQLVGVEEYRVSLRI